jgi:formate-dependent nitrite reductase cytochrome c552 subunit
MRSSLGKLVVILLFIFLFAICLSCSDGKLAKENAELRTENEALKKEINELKSKIENQSKQVMKEAVAALKKVEARLQVGISYQDYTKLLGETLYQVNLFLESSESIQKPELTASIKKVLSHYREGQSLWDYKLISGLSHFRQSDPLWPRIISLYPGAKHDDIDYTMQVIWKEANEELKKTVNLLSQQ